MDIAAGVAAVQARRVAHARSTYRCNDSALRTVGLEPRLSKIAHLRGKHDMSLEKIIYRAS